MKSIHLHLLITEMRDKVATSDPPKWGKFSDISTSFSEYVSERGSKILY